MDRKDKKKKKKKFYGFSSFWFFFKNAVLEQRKTLKKFHIKKSIF